MPHSHTPTHPHTHTRSDLFCVLALFLITCIVYGSPLFGGKALLPADIVILMRPWAATAHERFPDFRAAQNQLHGPIFEYYSWRRYAADRIHAGEVPLWNPDELGGNVLLANSQSAVLYPPNILLYLLPLWYGINLVTALHTFLTGLFMYGLLRALRLPAAAALTGALAWMFCGVLMVWTEFQTPTAALCWLPAVLWCWELYRQRGDWRWAVFGSGTAIALSLLAGHLQFAFYVVLAFALYTVWGAVANDRRPDKETRRQGDKETGGRSGNPQSAIRNPQSAIRNPQLASSVLCLVASLAFGLALSFATMLPVLEMGRYNFRAAKSDYAQAIELRMPPAQLATLLLPNVYGSPADYVVYDDQGRPMAGNDYFGAFAYVEYTEYTGIPALILALVGIGHWVLGVGSSRRQAVGLSDKAGDEESAIRNPQSAIRNSLVPYFLALSAIGLLLALGTPLVAVLFYGVPGYRQFNATGRAVCLFDFGAAALAAYGVAAMLEAAREGALRRAGALVGAAAGVVASVGLAAFFYAGRTLTQPDSHGARVPLLSNDQWSGYEMANLRHFLLFLALSALCAWLLLHRRDPRDTATGGASPAPTPNTEPRTPNAETRLSTLDSRLVWLLPAVAVADLLVWGNGFNPRTDPAMLGYPTDTTTYLQGRAPDRVVSLESPGKGIKSFIVPNYNAVWHLREVQGADSLHTLRYHQLLQQVVLAMQPGRATAFADPNTLHVPSVGHRFFDMMNVRYVTTDGPEPPAPGYRLAQPAELNIWENPRAFGPAWVAGRTEAATSPADFVSFLSDPRFDPRRVTMVDRRPTFAETAGATGMARVTTFSPHRVAYDVTATGAALLVTSETAFPGWHATVDGRPSPVITANWILRATPIPAGAHHVEFRYQPASYRFGLYVSALALGLLAAGLTCGTRRRKPIL